MIKLSQLTTLSLLSAALLSAQAGAQSTLTWWTRASSTDQVKALTDAYTKKMGVKFKITPIPDAQFTTKFATAVAGGQAPDLAAIDIVYMANYTQSGQLTDISSLVKALPFAKSLSAGHMKVATLDGKIYSLPLGFDASFLIYNKDLFRKAGLDPNKPPANFAQIEAASKKITALGDGVKGFYFSGACAGCNAFTFLPLIWASGGNALSSDGKTATLNDPAIKSALEFYQRLYKDGQMPAGAQVDNGTNFANAFTTGKVGMLGTGNFIIATLKRDFPKLDFGVTYLPGKNGNWSSFTGGDVVAIPKGSKNEQAARDFLTWMVGNDAQINVIGKGGWLPVRTDLANNKYTRADPRVVLAATTATKGQTPYSAKYYQLFNDANGPWLAMLQDAVFKGDVDGAISKAQAAFTKILDTK